MERQEERQMGDIVSLALIAATFGLFALLIRIFDRA
jgi:hypothetical protein